VADAAQGLSHGLAAAPPGSPEAQRRVLCVSPNQNRKGAGVPGPHGVLFFALYWCPVHGIEKVFEAVRRNEAKLR
jgi:hypothetical protein